MSEKDGYRNGRGEERSIGCRQALLKGQQQLLCERCHTIWVTPALSLLSLTTITANCGELWACSRYCGKCLTDLVLMNSQNTMRPSRRYLVIYPMSILHFSDDGRAQFFPAFPIHYATKTGLWIFSALSFQLGWSRSFTRICLDVGIWYNLTDEMSG